MASHSSASHPPQNKTGPGNPHQDANGNTNDAPTRRGTNNPYAAALLSLQPGNSFTIRKDNKLRSNVRRMARYYSIPIITKTASCDEIRVWRKDPTKYVERQQIKFSKNVPPPSKPTDVLEVIKLREAKAAAKKAREAAIQKVELVNDDQHSVLLVIVRKPKGGVI
ncbi:MAG TPA: hypothetical protein VLK33_03755 [Terriglobales bacterium]|nr:hypothetical protein [Terriglobales bacterium]